MRHVFIINPKAGKSESVRVVTPAIEKYFTEHGGSHVCHVADTFEKAIEATHAEAVATGGEPMRVYAVGGDGTLFAVANGAAAHPHVELGSIPCGSGNDFIKNFGPADAFLDVAAMVEGTSVPIDAIRCNEWIGINICSMGMDAAVAYKMLQFKKTGLFTGPMAYQLSTIATVLGKIGVHLDISVDGGETISGDFLFALAANGQVYGGGYRGAPKALVDDGLLDFILIRKIPKMRIFSLLPVYKAGGHLDLDICTFLRGRKMTVRPARRSPINMDGDVVEADSVTFEVLPKALRFILPKGLSHA